MLFTSLLNIILITNSYYKFYSYYFYFIFILILVLLLLFIGAYQCNLTDCWQNSNKIMFVIIIFK